MNNMGNNSKIKVYFDGLCKVCSREIGLYKRQEGAKGIEFIDICSSSFDASKEDLDPIQIHKIMHVRRADGSLATRVDAFIEIWSVLPKFQWLAKLARRRPLKAGLEFGYSGFKLIRPLLPRYSDPKDCEDSPYCEVKNI